MKNSLVQYLPNPASIIFLLIFFIPQNAYSQNCNNDSSYYSIQYRGPSQNTFQNAIITNADEMVALGQQSMIREGNFVAKFTSQGNILWSNQYQTNYLITSPYQYPWYSNLVFNKISISVDSTYLLTGSVVENGELANNAEIPPPHQCGVIIKIDKFGNIKWSKKMGIWGTDYSIENVQPLTNGDLLIYMVGSGISPLSWVLYINSAGNIVWGTPLQMQWPAASGVTHAMTQLANGNIVLGDIIYRNQDLIITLPPPNSPQYLPAPLYYLNFTELDKNTGKIRWNQNYLCPVDKASIPLSFVPDIKHISSLANGTLSFFADMYMPPKSSGGYTNKAVNLITDSTGQIQQIIDYSEPNSSCQLINVQDQSATQVIFTKSGSNGQAVVTKLDRDGQILSTKGYGNASSGLPVTFALQNNEGNRSFILLSNSESKNMQMLITDTAGNIPCGATVSLMSSEKNSWNYRQYDLSFLQNNIGIDFNYNDLKTATSTYPLTSQVDCKYQYVCCTDIVDSTNITQVALCEGGSYRLPDSTLLTDSGMYYLTYKTPKGCDSTVFYKVTVSKNPQSLSLVSDTCMNGMDSIIVHASDSFAIYNWMNNPSNQPYYTIYHPGIYWVSVSNICGMKTDSVQVFDQCRYPITMPNAFTPNGDGKNDIFRVPSGNKNKLIQLMVYNRWGELVFSSSSQNLGWDGNYKGQKQPSGTYVYYLLMQDLNNQVISQKGTVILVR